MLIIFENSLDSDQAQHNDGPDFDPNYIYGTKMEIIFLEKVNFEKDQQNRQQKIMKNFQACKELSFISCMIIIQVALVQIKVSFIVGKNGNINLCHPKPGYILFSEKSAD